MRNWAKKLFRNSSSVEHWVRTDFPQLADLETGLGYHFSDPLLLLVAITHPSCHQEASASEMLDHNQRLEFLGDSVLSLILAEKLFDLFPDEREGVLAKSRSALAKGTFLSKLARQLSLDAFLRMSRHEESRGGRKRAAALEDALEAIIGAVYLDSDYPTVREVVLNWYGDIETVLASTLRHENPKGKLQEKMQSASPPKTIEYKILTTEGPDHRKVFTVEVLIDGECWGTGSGKSKKDAEEAAARLALKM